MIRGRRTSRAISIASFLGYQGVDIILGNYHSRSSVVKDSESDRTARSNRGNNERSMSKWRIGKIATTLEFGQRHFFLVLRVAVAVWFAKSSLVSWRGYAPAVILSCGWVIPRLELFYFLCVRFSSKSRKRILRWRSFFRWVGGVVARVSDRPVENFDNGWTDTNPAFANFAGLWYKYHTYIVLWIRFDWFDGQEVQAVDRNLHWNT